MTNQPFIPLPESETEAEDVDSLGALVMEVVMGAAGVEVRVDGLKVSSHPRNSRRTLSQPDYACLHCS